VWRSCPPFSPAMFNVCECCRRAPAMNPYHRGYVERESHLICFRTIQSSSIMVAAITAGICVSASGIRVHCGSTCELQQESLHVHDADSKHQSDMLGTDVYRPVQQHITARLEHDLCSRFNNMYDSDKPALQYWFCNVDGNCYCYPAPGMHASNCGEYS
jgi:hypothetical protein